MSTRRWLDEPRHNHGYFPVPWENLQVLDTTRTWPFPATGPTRGNLRHQRCTVFEDDWLGSPRVKMRIKMPCVARDFQEVPVCFSSGMGILGNVEGTPEIIMLNGKRLGNPKSEKMVAREFAWTPTEPPATPVLTLPRKCGRSWNSWCFHCWCMFVRGL